MRTIVYPGTFNPITNGHTDLVERAARIFDHVIVGVGTSTQKSSRMSLEKRVELLEGMTRKLRELQSDIRQEKGKLLFDILKDFDPEDAVGTGMVTLNLRSVVRVMRRRRGK